MRADTVPAQYSRAGSQLTADLKWMTSIKNGTLQPSRHPVSAQYSLHLRTWGENRFDLIHGRLLMGSVSSYPNLYKQAYGALKPGGWLEISEADTTLYSDDGTVTDDMAVSKWAKLWDEAIEKVGKRIPKAEE